MREKVFTGRMLQLIVRGELERLHLFERDLPSLGAVEKLYPRMYETGRAVYDALLANERLRIVPRAQCCRAVGI